MARGDERGQATVEAAFCLPIVMGLMLLLLQPGIVLYDRIVMQAAAAEGCRLLSTLPNGSEERCKQYVRNRLGAIPQQDSFHVHGGECSYVVDLQGDSSSNEVTVTITNRIDPLPLMGFTAGLLGLCDEDGLLPVVVASSMKTQPDWVQSSPQGRNPQSWVGAWL